jgi:hypothetical protein
MVTAGTIMYYSFLMHLLSRAWLKGGIPNLATHFVVLPTFREVLAELSSFPVGGGILCTVCAIRYCMFRRCLGMLSECHHSTLTAIQEYSENVSRDERAKYNY